MSGLAARVVRLPPDDRCAVTAMLAPGLLRPLIGLCGCLLIFQLCCLASRPAFIAFACLCCLAAAIIWTRYALKRRAGHTERPGSQLLTSYPTRL